MKNIIFPIFFLFIVAISIGQTAQMAKDAESIQHLLSDLSNAWNVHDAKAFSMGFSEDADFTNVVGMSAHGRSEIEKFHENHFQPGLKTAP